MTDPDGNSGVSRGDDRIRCDACPVMCYIRPGQAGACDRYANDAGQLVRVDLHVILRRTIDGGGRIVPFSAEWDGRAITEPREFVTAIDAGTTYPDYKPAPFIVSSVVEGVDMVTVVTEGIFNYCGVKVKIDRVLVNNGGDIALYFAPGEDCRVGLAGRPDRASLFGTTTITVADGVRGVATSGWRGRSFSLGIADAVTVLAACAADADAAATMVANAVNLPGHPAIQRVPAAKLQPDNDLGQQRVTRAVGPLAAEDIHRALDGGVAVAERLLRAGRIATVALHCQGDTRVVGRQAFKANTREAIHA